MKEVLPQCNATKSCRQKCNATYFSGKSQTNVPATSLEQKQSEIGYVSNLNATQDVTANIPVATESLQKFHAVQQGGKIVDHIRIATCCLKICFQGKTTNLLARGIETYLPDILKYASNQL